MTQPLRPRIVLAAHPPELRSVVATSLRELDCEVLEAADGAELLERLEDGTVTDLVICDLELPQLSGLEALSCLRRSDWTIPFILMTSATSPQTHQAATQMGATYVFHKPLDLRHLVSTARSIVE